MVPSHLKAVSATGNISEPPKNMTGLVLTAGGARGAYQAGVLKRIGEIRVQRDRKTPFPIVAGASAGAINGTAVAAGAEEFSLATRFLAQLWSNLETDSVFRTDIGSLSKNAVSWVKDLSFGGLIGGGRVQALLDSTPLRGFLKDYLQFERIQGAIDKGSLYAVGITATNYISGKSYTFVQGQNGHPVWEKSRRLAVATRLELDHVLASSAIPIVFAPMKLRTSEGEFYFGDGALRLITPCSPAIRLGAEKIFAIGIRSQKASDHRTHASMVTFEKDKQVMRQPPLAQVLGVVLNAIFLDHLDSDIEHLIRINEIVASFHGELKSEVREPVKKVEPMIISPSTDLAIIAESRSSKMPAVVRYMMEGLGTSKAESSDLMSYLLFDSGFTRALVDLGYRDAHERIAEIEQFLYSDSRSAQASG